MQKVSINSFTGFFLLQLTNCEMSSIINVIYQFRREQKINFSGNIIHTAKLQQRQYVDTLYPSQGVVAADTGI